MIKIVEQIVEAFEDFGESLKTKEYVCYCRNDAGFINETYLIKKELYKFSDKLICEDCLRELMKLVVNK